MAMDGSSEGTRGLRRGPDGTEVYLEQSES